MSFDLIAPHYQWIETIAFGNKLQEARLAFLHQISTPKRVLIAGEGNGRFLCELLRTHPRSEVDCVDASAGMLELARDRAGNDQQRVRFRQEDLLTWSPGKNSYDLIVTHFFLDCFRENEIGKIVANLARAATRDAVWLLADFAVPPTPVAGLHARIWLWSMHHFFRILAGINARCLTNPSSFLQSHGFQCVNRRNLRMGLVKSELWRRS